jgi:formate hydrogenlyase subunit 6/NADH:ubiquinone oxidoreductase subunit I
MSPAAQSTRSVVELEGFERLIPSLECRGFQVVGPTLRDGAIVYEPLRKLENLPAGWSDETEAGRYRLQERHDGALFGYSLAPQSWKKFLHPAELRLFEVKRDEGAFRILNNTDPPPRYAFLGVRACELAAIRAQDRVFLEDRFTDPRYESRRRPVFIIAVNCTRSAPTCFCASMQTGPGVGKGFDLAVTEILASGGHQFVIEVGTEAGAEILQEMSPREASPALCQQAEEAVRSASRQTRSIDTTGIRELLNESFDHPRWEKAATRCLSCANCTMVCPTCFCTTVEDASGVNGGQAERLRKWDSCFTQAFSYIHGGSVRTSVKSRYRQWLTHKMASWIDQFGSSGCVGCGRCIVWCPAGIDLTEEVRAIREEKEI